VIGTLNEGMILRNSSLSDALELIHTKVRPLSLTLAEQQAAKKIAYDYFPTIDASKNGGTCIAPIKPTEYYRDKFYQAQISSLSSEPELQSWDFTSKLYLRDLKDESGVLVFLDAAPNYRTALLEILQKTGFEPINPRMAKDEAANKKDTLNIYKMLDDAVKQQTHPLRSFFTYRLVSWDDFKSSVPYFEALINNQKPSNEVRAKLARHRILKSEALRFLKDGSLSYYEVIQKADREHKALESANNGYGITIDELAVYR